MKDWGIDLARPAETGPGTITGRFAAGGIVGSSANESAAPRDSLDTDKQREKRSTR